MLLYTYTSTIRCSLIAAFFSSFYFSISRFFFFLFSFFISCVLCTFSLLLFWLKPTASTGLGNMALSICSPCPAPSHALLFNASLAVNGNRVTCYKSYDQGCRNTISCHVAEETHRYLTGAQREREKGRSYLRAGYKYCKKVVQPYLPLLLSLQHH